MDYTLRIVGRGENIAYRDSSGELWLQRTYNRVNRLYCGDTQKLPFSRRKAVVENLCDYFHTLSEPSVFVLDEGDKDRKDLEALFDRLVGGGHKITVEYDSAKKQEQFEEGTYLSVIRAGKKLVIEGVELTSEADYWEWKRKARPGTAPSNDPTALARASRATERPPFKS